MPELPYLERLPRTPSANSPLLILLHGRAAEAKTIFSIEGLLDPSFHVIAIRATYPSALGGFEWFRPDEECEDLPPEMRFAESEELLTEQIAQMRVSRGLQSAPLYLWGFSQGAAMSYFLGLRGILRPERIVPMAGFLPSPIRSWEPLYTGAEFLIAHGTNDEVLDTTASTRADEFLRENGIRSEYYEFKGRHKMTLNCVAHVNDWLIRSI